MFYDRASEVINIIVSEILDNKNNINIGNINNSDIDIIKEK